MSKKVLFYMVLDLIGIGITLVARALLCNAFMTVSELWVQTAFVLVINVISIGICLFIIFFFLLYWWSDRKWTRIKNKFEKKK